MRVTTGAQMGGSSEPTERGLAPLVARLTDGLTRLVSQHLTLARAEMVEDARAVGADLARIAVFVPFVLVGYGFLCAALAVALAPWLSLTGSLALVGGLNLVGGGVGVARSASHLKSHRVMDETTTELTRSVSALAQSEASHGR
jgi:hypothetical protein